MELQYSVIRSFYTCVIVVAAASGIGSAVLRDRFSVITPLLSCDAEHDMCKHVDEIVTWLYSMPCAMENQARARSAREDSSVYIYIYMVRNPPKICNHTLD